MEAILTSPLGIVPLTKQVFTIGRSPNNGLFINDSSVSRHHAEIHADDQSYSVVDLGSTSGTFVNGQKLLPDTPRVLRSGDVIQVGIFALTFEEDRSAASIETLMIIPATEPPSPPVTPLPARHNLIVPPTPFPEPPEPVSSVDRPPDTPPVNGRGTSLRDFLPAPDMAALTSNGGAPRLTTTPGPPINLAQEQLQFTAFYPRFVPVETWSTLLVYAHIETALEAVRGDSQRLRDQIEADPSSSAAWVANQVTGGTQITVLPVFPGITFQPERISFSLTRPWQPAAFRFSVDRRNLGSAGSGEVLLLAGPLIIAALRISLRFAEPAGPPDTHQEEISIARYKRIFTSYSHDDTLLVQGLRQAYQALGDESFASIEALRAGRTWHSALARAIESADVFQLCWSQHAAQAPYVYQECQHALRHNKYDGFIRPIYWKKPLNFVPPEMAHLHFTYCELL